MRSHLTGIGFLVFVCIGTAALLASDSLEIATTADTWIDQDETTNNYGISEYVYAGDVFSLQPQWRIGLIWFDYSSYTYGTSALDSAAMYLYVTSINDAGTLDDTDSILSVHNVLLEWGEGDQDGACPQSVNDSAGANYYHNKCEDGGGGCNCDAVDQHWNTPGCWGEGTDYDNDDSVTFIVSALGWYRIRDLKDFVVWQMNNANYGFRIGDENPASSGKYLNIRITSEDYVPQELYMPYIVLYYTEGEGGPEENYRRRRLLQMGANLHPVNYWGNQVRRLEQ